MNSGWRRFIVVFFVFNLVISSFYLDIWKNANTTSRALPVITYFESGTFRIDRYHELTVDKAYVNQHYYTDKAPLPTYVMIPAFGLLKSTGIIKPDENGSLFGDHIYMLGGFFTASLPFAILLTVLFIRIRNSSSGVSPLLLSTLPFYASFIFVFTGTYFAHIFSAILLLLGYLLIRKNSFFWSGFAGGLAFLSEYNLAVILLLWGVMILIREQRFRPFLAYSLGILPALLFIVYYNSIFSSSPFTFMYKHHNFSELDTNYGFVLPSLKSFWGLTFSPYRGMFYYAPLLLTGFYFLYLRYRKGTLKSLLKSYLFFPFIIYFIFIASYFAWWGGWTYGPRLLLAMVLILLYRLVEYYSARPLPRYLFYPLVCLGLLIILTAKGTIAYSAPTGIMNPFVELVIAGMREGNFNPNNILTLFFGTDPRLAFFIFLAVFISGFTLLTKTFRKWKVQ